MERISNRERAAQKLLKGIPKAKPFGRLIDGKFVRGTLSLHRTRQGVAWNAFWRLHRRIGELSCS